MSQVKVIVSQFQNNNVYNLHLKVDRKDAEKFIEGNNRRIICQFASGFELQTSLMPYPEGYYILLSKSVFKQEKLEIEEQITVTMSKDNSEFGMAVPDELEALMAQDQQVFDFFMTLTPGKQRQLFYLVNKVKNPDSRMNKALAIAEHLKEAKGKLDFKALNEKIKAYNQLNKLK